MAGFETVLLALAVLATAGCLESKALAAAAEEEGMVNVTLEAVAAKLLEHELLIEPEGAAEILKIDAAYLSRAQEKYPAIYEGVEAGSYEVRIGKLLVIYDHEKDEVKKQYVVRSIDVGR